MLKILTDDSIKMFELTSGEITKDFQDYRVKNCKNFDYEPKQSILASACDGGVFIWDVLRVAVVKFIEVESGAFELRRGSAFRFWKTTLTYLT